MKHPRKRTKALAALLLALALSLSLSAPALAAEPHPAVDDAAAGVVRTAMTYGGADQIGWAVWRDGEIISSGQAGGPREDPDAGHLQSLAAAQAPLGSVYGVGSVSKIYTATAVLQLAEAGKLDLDQPVVKYLPAFQMADPRYKDITVRMLLNHSSGLMGSSFSSALLFDDDSRAAASQLLERLSAQRLKADPGAYSVYCNDGFTLAELVVEAVSGMDFQDYLRARIFAPAGLKETHFPGEDFESVRVPIYQPEDPRPLPKDCLGVLGTGGVYATAADLAAFGGALTDGTLLKKASLDAMAAPEYAKGLWPEGDSPSSLAFGLGWDSVKRYPFSQSGVTALVKGGDTQYYHAGLVVLPEHRLSAAVLSSGGVSTYNEMAASQMLIAALKELGVTVDESPLTLPEAQRAAMPQELLNAAGYYGSSLAVYRVDIAKDGTLTLSYPSSPELPERTFHYFSDGTFRAEAGTAAFRFVEEDNGRTYLHQWSFTDLSGLGGLPSSIYAAMKLPENPVDPALQADWESLISRGILPMNERYSSQVYLSVGALLAVTPDTQQENAPGYIGALRIEDASHLRYVAQLPGSTGRDGGDLELRRDAKGALWIHQSNGSVYMEMAAAPALSTGRDGRAACTIQPDGYARWYHVGSAAGKTMTVQVPENAGFWVYDRTGKVTASSVLWGNTMAALPEGGMAVFAGDPGAKFELTFS